MADGCCFENRKYAKLGRGTSDLHHHYHHHHHHLFVHKNAVHKMIVYNWRTEFDLRQNLQVDEEIGANLNFLKYENPRWRTAAILKFENSQ